jgi:hypothetical protein
MACRFPPSATLGFSLDLFIIKKRESPLHDVHAHALIQESQQELKIFNMLF